MLATWQQQVQAQTTTGLRWDFLLRVNWKPCWKPAAWHDPTPRFVPARAPYVWVIWPEVLVSEHSDGQGWLPPPVNIGHVRPCSL